MLYDEIENPSETTPDDLRSRYRSELADAIDADVDADDAVVEAIRGGSVAAVTVSEAASVLGEVPDAPSGDVIEAEVRDQLLLGMTTAVLDVDALAARVESDLTPREIQQKVEGRAPMTLAEYAELRCAIERGKR